MHDLINERAANFHKNAFDLVMLAFGSAKPDMIRPAALMLVNAPADTEMGRRQDELRACAINEVRKWIWAEKPDFVQLATLIQPLIDATLLEEGCNVFRPASVVAELESRAVDFIAGRDVIEVGKVPAALPIILQTMFAQDVISVVDKQLWIRDAGEIEPGLLRALSSRPDFPISCLVPTGKALIEIGRRIIAHQLATRCGLRVPLDLSGIEWEREDRALPLKMPTKGTAS